MTEAMTPSPERIAELTAKAMFAIASKLEGQKTTYVVRMTEAECALYVACDPTTILSLLSALDARTKALEAVFSVGDGWDVNTEADPAGTTGEGHARCREIARAALAGQEERA